MANHREGLSKYARRLAAKGLVAGPGGNISVRDGTTMLISPSGYDLSEIEPEMWCTVDLNSGQYGLGEQKPSSEVAMHLDIFRARPDITAIIHTHPVNCIALGLVSRELPVCFPDQAALLGEVEFIDYIIPTTQELADAVVSKAMKADTLMLVNHGLVALGRNLREAYYRTEVAEESAKIFLLASAFGQPKRLTFDEVKAIRSLDSEFYRINLMQERQ
ncbi:class II aldolase/adducin family protein [Paenibacillus sp. CC-CFT747]|nr:class II aldolase/adducin family protein [Paenibacillus sp. CC-CFT747]